MHEKVNFFQKKSSTMYVWQGSKHAFVIKDFIIYIKHVYNWHR